MEASTYAWAVILTFFILYATIQLRKCFLQLLSSGETNTGTNRLSNSSVYTIENDSAVRTIRNDQDILGCVNNSYKHKDDLPSYEEVIASENLNPIHHLSHSSTICLTTDVSLGTRSSNVTTTSNATIDR